MASVEQVQDLNNRVTALETLSMPDWKAEVTQLLEQMNKLETVSLRTPPDLVKSQDARLQELEKANKAQVKQDNRFRRVQPYQHWKSCMTTRTINSG